MFLPLSKVCDAAPANKFELEQQDSDGGAPQRAHVMLVDQIRICASCPNLAVTVRSLVLVPKLPSP